MARRQAKKPEISERNTNSAGLLIFKSSETDVDMRIEIFEKEYHVHSSVLRSHSAFFRRFLDSPEKPQAVASDSSPFRYDYVSVIDDDGEWSLEPLSMAKGPRVHRKLKDTRTFKTEQRAFGRLLRAMYKMPYTIVSVAELGDMTRLADYYLALPAVSASLEDRKVWENYSLSWSIFSDPLEALWIAKKLRHRILFREALIHAVGDAIFWEGNHQFAPCTDLPCLDDQLNLIVFRAHSQFCTLKLQVDHAIVVALTTGKLTTHTIGEFQDFLSGFKAPALSQIGPPYYEALLEKLDTMSDPDDEFLDLKTKLRKLLQDNSSLPATLRIRSYFVCADIKDEDLPWDPTKTDW